MRTKQRFFLPVIHVHDSSQALRNMRLVYSCAADGCFLINHGIPWSMLLEIAEEHIPKFKDWWIGVNCLDLSPEETFLRVSSNISGVWTDNAEINEMNEEQDRAETILKAKKNWKGKYFGGVAFKYQREVDDVTTAARLAKPFVDVVVTSGPGTGQAAEIEKIQAMRSGLGDFPLALASGVTLDNVCSFLPYVDYFLVATGISKTFFEIDERKCAQMARIIHPIA